MGVGLHARRENMAAAMPTPPEGRDDDCSIVYAPWYMVAFLKPDTMPSSFAMPIP